MTYKSYSKEISARRLSPEGELHRREDQDLLVVPQPVRDTYVRYLPQGSVAYDLGAFEGNATAAFMKLKFRIFAFEGSIDNFELLRGNITGYARELNFGDVRLYNIALGTEDKDVVTRFNDSRAIEGQYKEQLIRYRVLEKFIQDNSLPSPDLIKMDIEGMESVVLPGCTNLLEKVRPIWQLSIHENIEFESENYPGFISKEDGGFDFNTFKNLDYNLYDINMKKVTEIGGDEEFILVPKEKIPMLVTTVL